MTLTIGGTGQRSCCVVYLNFMFKDLSITGDQGVRKELAIKRWWTEPRGGPVQAFRHASHPLENTLWPKTETGGRIVEQQGSPVFGRVERKAHLTKGTT